MLELTSEEAKRFWSKVNKTATCWLWTASKSREYGQVVLRYKHYSVHVFSYMLHSGMIPDGLVVMHACDNKLCVNPDHLNLGTYADNSADAISKGRYWNGKSANVLTKDMPAKMRKLHEAGLLQREIGEELGVSSFSVSKVLRGIIPKHLTQEVT